MRLVPGEKLWNGKQVTEGLASAYNSLSERIESFEREGRKVPEYLLNGRHNLLTGEPALNRKKAKA